MKFSIKSEKLELLRPLFEKAIELINKAAREKRQIIIRHHDDVDGYSAGYLLEKAIAYIIDDKRGYQLTRSASRTPFYDYIDAIKDLSGFAGYNSPLIILTDLGSNEQSIKAIKRLKPYGTDFLIIDHHIYDKENQELATVFLNPHIFNFGSDLNAGILCFEIAHNLYPNIRANNIPAISAIADKSKGIEIEEYIKLSKSSFELLDEWAILLDHEFFHFKFPVRLNMLDELFTNYENLASLKKELDKDFSRIRDIVKRHAVIKEIKGIILQRIERLHFGDFDYASYKLPRIAHDMINGERITLIVNDESISYRAELKDFDGVKMIEFLKKSIPDAMITGGGHAAAGGIRFNSNFKEEVIKKIEEYLC